MEWFVISFPLLLSLAISLGFFLTLRFLFKLSFPKALSGALFVFILVLFLSYWQKFSSPVFLSQKNESLVAQVTGSSGGRETAINLYEINDWQPAWVFVDIMKMARDWSDCDNWKESPTVPLTSDGYPIEIPYGNVSCVKSIWAHDWSHWPTGDYTLTFEGKGEIQLKGKTYSSSGGRVSFFVNMTTGDNSMILKINKSDKSNPVRNIHLIMPGYSNSFETQIFHPKFLEGLQGVSVIRFMNWTRTNYEWSEAEPSASFFDWENRTKTSNFTQARKWGVAPEYVVALANRLRADVWINIPHSASDNYVVNYAKFLNDNLNSDLKIYIEYSNELWNGGTYRHQDYANKKGAALGFESGLATHYAGRAYHVYRSAQIFRIFENQFSNDSRLVRVIASQAANSWWGQQLLKYFDSLIYNPHQVKIDALAIAPYFGGSLNPSSGVTVDDILSLAQKSIYTDTQAWTRKNIEIIKDYCDKKGLSDKCVKLVAYEGGQHLRSSNSATNDKLVEANRHPKMGDLFDEMFGVWETENPGGLFTIFVYASPYGKYGSWGMFEYQDQMDTPKYNSYRKRLSGYLSKCVESWSCSDWSPSDCPESGIQTRTCIDTRVCGTSVNKPLLTQACSYNSSDLRGGSPQNLSSGGGTNAGAGGVAVSNSGPSSGLGADPSVSSEDSRILLLKEQVLKLQKILAGLLGKKQESNIKENFSSHYFSLDLRLGSRGKEVANLQAKLNKLGYLVANYGPGSPGFETDYFGQATRKALIKYQLDNRLILSSTGAGAGLFGPKTRKSLNSK